MNLHISDQGLRFRITENELHQLKNGNNLKICLMMKTNCNIAIEIHRSFKTNFNLDSDRYLLEVTPLDLKQVEKNKTSKVGVYLFEDPIKISLSIDRHSFKKDSQ